MHKQGVFKAAAIGILLTLCLFPGLAHANNVAVNCPGASINAALAGLPANGPNTITVTGTCNEAVVISDMRSLTIIGAGGAKIVQPQNLDTFTIVRSQNVNLGDLEIVGVPGSPLGSGGLGVNITEASDVHIIGCDVHDNESGGVFAGQNSIVFLLNHTNIHNNTDGLDVGLNSSAFVRATTIQNNGNCSGFGTCNNPGFGRGVGVFLTSDSSVSLGPNTLIQNNGDIGIQAGGVVSLHHNVTIQGHNITGILVRGSHLQVNPGALIQGNGGGCPPHTPIPCGGIVATKNATVEIDVATVTGNHGAGIFVDQGSNVHLSGATVSNNSGDGVHIRRISIGDFTAPFPGASNNTITGNGGASVFCDARSLAIGDLDAFSKVKCANVQEK